MALAITDSVLYKVIWTFDGGKLDITKYIINQSSDEGLTIENNKISLTIKLVKDFNFGTTNVPFYVNSVTGKQMFSKSSFLDVFIKNQDDNGDINTDSEEDKFKTFFITDYDISEPDNKISLNAVDLQYKVTNRNISENFRERYNGTSTSIATDILTDTGNTFPLPSATGRYEDGLKLMTLDIDDGVTRNTYLITSNTATSVTVHKTIVESSPASYKIGESSPFALYKTIERTGRDAAGRGETFLQMVATASTDIGSDYSQGIQFLRPDNSAFPIIDLGEPFKPVYKLIDELSGFGACNLPAELESIDDMVIKRDMIFTVNFNGNNLATTVNWFYLDKPEKSTTSRTITNVVDDVITVSSGVSNDVGGIARVELTDRTLNFNILSVSGNDYTVDRNAEDLGVTTESFYVFKSVDFIWDNIEDYKDIFSYKLGGKDEENYNHVIFIAGTNPVAETKISGHYFNEQTKSATLKETFLPLSFIADNMINYEIRQQNLRKNNDVWEGNDGAGGFTPDTGLWDWTTNFGFGVDYVITSRTSFNTAFKKAARAKGKSLARNLAIAQKENVLKGTFRIKGRKFIKTSEGNTINSWYQKGSRILFKKPDTGLLNDGTGYFYFVVKKIRQSVDSSRWTTNLDVEYNTFTSDEILK